jgi:hypothetical protein
MRKTLRLLLVLSAWCAFARTPEEIHALTHGAKAKCVLRVVDDLGAIVTNAAVVGNFHMNDDKGHPFRGITDTNGMYVASGTCVGDWHYVIKKTGFYETGRDLWYFSSTNTSISAGRWQPYGATNTVVLKRKVNPVAMYCKTVNVILPAKGMDFGFDCKMGDLVKPHGKGSEPDFFLNYSLVYDTNNVWNATNHLYITFRPHDGAAMMKCDTTSQMQTAFSAPEDGYMKQISFYLKSETRARREKKEFLADDYILFKSRTEIDANGCETNMHFGKIISRGFWYGEISKDGAGGGVTFSYYLNPTPNDRNLEFDGKNNLLDRDGRDSWPHEP